jgi:3-isopropylmalate/(R)-2-methylmalate dehydratase small subunit
MSLTPFERLDAVAVPIAQANVDTDQILPAPFLQKPRSDDFGAYLFCNLRFRKDGSEDPGFVLNLPAYRGAGIVVAERNFGCGSSREHAVWALYDYGIRVVVAPSFGDIFFANALKNGLLPIVLSAPVVAGMIGDLQAAPGSHVVVDLEAQTVTGSDGRLHRFDVDHFSKQCLLSGLDELDFTLSLSDRIAEFERSFDGMGADGRASPKTE